MRSLASASAPSPGDALRWDRSTASSTQSTWREDITLESLGHVMDFRPIDVVPGIAPRASCFVAAAGYDAVHPLDQILEAYKRWREPRQLHLLPEKGMDLRFDPAWSRCLALAVDWFDAHLSRRRWTT